MGCSGATSDVQPLYFTTTSEPQTGRRMLTNVGQRLELSRTIGAESRRSRGVAAEVDACNRGAAAIKRTQSGSSS